MAQKIHGDLEVAGDLVVGGVGGGAVKIVSLVLKSTGIAITQPSWPTHMAGSGAYIIPDEAVNGDPRGLWNEATGEFTAGEKGSYDIVFDKAEFPTASHAAFRLYFFIDTGSGYVLYAIGGTEGRARRVVDQSQDLITHSSLTRVKLSAGDKIKFGFMVSAHPYQNGHPIHKGNSEASIEIWKR